MSEGSNPSTAVDSVAAWRQFRIPGVLRFSSTCLAIRWEGRPCLCSDSKTLRTAAVDCLPKFADNCEEVFICHEIGWVVRRNLLEVPFSIICLNIINWNVSWWCLNSNSTTCQVNFDFRFEFDVHSKYSVPLVVKIANLSVVLLQTIFHWNSTKIWSDLWVNTIFVLLLN